MSIENLYADLYALYFSLIDQDLSDISIIIELKLYLLNRNIDGIGSSTQINYLISHFYIAYDIPINEQLINSTHVVNLNYNDENLINVYEHDEKEELDELEEKYDDDDLPALIGEDDDDDLPALIGEDDDLSVLIGEDDDADLPELISRYSIFPILNSFGPNRFAEISGGNSISLREIFNNSDMYQDIRVTLDDEDLNNLPTKQLESNLDSNCSICLNEMIEHEFVTSLICEHNFHTECIKPYLENYSYKCPLCRTECGRSKARL